MPDGGELQMVKGGGQAEGACHRLHVDLAHDGNDGRINKMIELFPK